MRKRPSIASVYLVSVSHQCIASVPTFETIHPSFFTPHPSDFDWLETALSAPSGVNVARDVSRNVSRNVSRGVARDVVRNVTRDVVRNVTRDVVRNVVRNVTRDVVRNVVRGVSRNVARDVARGVGRMRQYDHLTGEGSPPLFYISHNLSVDMGDFTDKLLTLNNLSVRTCLFTDKPVIFGVNPCQDYARLSVSR